MNDDRPARHPGLGRLAAGRGARAGSPFVPWLLFWLLFWPLLTACAAQGPGAPHTGYHEGMSATQFFPPGQGDSTRQRVIVTLRVDSTDGDREAAIRQAQSALLEDLATGRFDLVQRYRYVPQLVLDADAETVRRIARHPAVTDVRADRPVPPTGGRP